MKGKGKMSDKPFEFKDLAAFWGRLSRRGENEFSYSGNVKR